MVIDTPEPPYYAVIFTSILTPGDHGYSETAARILELARQQQGFLGFEAARQEQGISVSYWMSLEAIKAWKEHPEHRAAQESANRFYESYRVRVCRVEKEYGA